ncbi:hypothetical protein [Chroococcidiopsis sp. TS-821]|nr:hypothetical protein [Chroococcidiopsis sp. TS-821]
MLRITTCLSAKRVGAASFCQLLLVYRQIFPETALLLVAVLESNCLSPNS